MNNIEEDQEKEAYADDGDCYYGNYRIVDLYGQMIPHIADKIISFWRKNHALPANESGQERVRQIVLAAFNEKDEVIGVNTVYPGKLKGDGPLFFIYRQFIQPEDRVFGLMRYMTMKAWAVLGDKEIEEKPEGVIIITENRKLMRPGIAALFNKWGWQHLGRSPKNEDIWLKKFY